MHGNHFLLGKYPKSFLVAIIMLVKPTMSLATLVCHFSTSMEDNRMNFWSLMQIVDEWAVQVRSRTGMGLWLWFKFLTLH